MNNMEKNKKVEGMENAMGINVEALETLSSMYNKGKLTISDLHVTGDVQTDGTINAKTINAKAVTADELESTKNINAKGIIAGDVCEFNTGRMRKYMYYGPEWDQISSTGHGLNMKGGVHMTQGATVNSILEVTGRLNVLDGNQIWLKHGPNNADGCALACPKLKVNF
jgi:hypothetical protein